MDFFYQFLELFATFVEGAIVLFVSTSLAGRKLTKNKNIIFILFATVIYMVIITLMNNWQVFSFATIAVAMIYTFVVLFFTTTGNVLYKISATIIAWFFMHATDYILSYSLIMILGKSIDISEGIPLILYPGTTRLIYILSDKLLQIVLFSAFHKLYPKLKLLSKKSVGLIFIFTLLSYIVMSILTNLIVTDSLVTIQLAVIFSLFFIVLNIVVTIVSIAISAKYQQEKREKELMTLTNTMMEKNYTEMNHSQDVIRKQVHDFKNHLRTVYGMMSDDSKAKDYIGDLLETSYKQAQYCHSGNEIIDSIINCKMNEALSNRINFEHKINLDSKLNISSVDICAILANQLDNSIEACLKTESKRFIKVDIWQKESLVFFKVINSAEKNPFDSHHNLFTTKNDKSMHGLGIKNIRETSEKYNGSLKNEYKDGCFISIAMVSNNA